MKSKGAFGKVMKFLVPLVVTVGLCWIMFRNIDFAQMMSIIRDQCDFRWIALALLLSIFSHVFRAFRWRIQLMALGINAPRYVLVYSIFGTYAVNLVFPRLGEVWRSGYIANRQDAKFSAVFGSMVADRLADTVTVVLLTLLTFILASGHITNYLHENAESYRKIEGLLGSPWLWGAFAALIAFVWWFMTRKAAPNTIFSRVQNFVKGLWQGFAVIVKMPGKLRWLGYTIALWGCYFLQMYVAFYAFPFTSAALSQYGIIVAQVTFVISSISMGVPSNGGIGPWQWAVIFALGLYGVDKTDASAFANLVLGSQTLLLILLGLYTFIAIMLDKKRHQNNTH